MKIAITCENGQLFQHFGHTPELAVFEVEAGKIISKKILSCSDTGHGALAGLLAQNDVQLLICGGIGGGAINALKERGIEVVGGASGEIENVIKSFLSGTLQLNENFYCNHHREGGHSCHGNGHSCGN